MTWTWGFGLKGGSPMRGLVKRDREVERERARERESDLEFLGSYR